MILFRSPIARLALALLLLSPTAAPQDFILRGARVQVPNGHLVEGLDVWVRGSRIHEIGPEIHGEASTRVVLLPDRVIHPGLIDFGNQIGLTEIGSVRGTVDTSEAESFNPHLRILTGINPHSSHIPVARANGILFSVVFANAGIVSGLSPLVRLFGDQASSMAVKPEAFLVVTVPRLELPPLFERTPPGVRKAGREGLAPLKKRFAAARRYLAARRKSARLGTDAPPMDLHAEALRPVLEGKLPVLFRADSVEAITAAVDFGTAEHLQIVLHGCRDAWKIADFLAARKVDCVLSSVYRRPALGDPYDAVYANAFHLQRAGVRIAFSTGSSSNVRNLPYEAAMAVSFGLPAPAARRALTSDAAAILGLRRRIGILRPGAEATFFVSTGDILDATSRVEEVFVKGRPVATTSRHTRLRDRFLPPRKGDGARH